MSLGATHNVGHEFPHSQDLELGETIEQPLGDGYQRVGEQVPVPKKRRLPQQAAAGVGKRRI